MPRRSKKSIFSNKNTVKFVLGHRSQKDPLAADDDAPQRVLLPVSGQGSFYASKETLQQRESRLSKQRTYGINFDDDYDYMQHLKDPRDEEKAVMVPVLAEKVASNPPEKSSGDIVEVANDDKTVVRLPSVVFGSKQEEEVGMLHRAIPPKGPQPSWDPDVVAGLDEDFDYDNPDNLLEDDFVLKASEEMESDDDKASDSGTEVGSDFSGGMFPESGDDEEYFSEEETRSRFTNYSMTSSVIRRNDQLSHLDDRFEKFYETYDDECIGDIPQIEIDGVISTEHFTEKREIMMLLGLKEEEESYDDEDDKHRFVYDVTADDGDDMVTIVKEEETEKWDCESILSTYSTRYNHPKLIEEPVKSKIKISQKTGFPVDDRPKLTKKQLQSLEAPVDGARRKKEEMNHRSKNETKEEKKLRKKSVKEARKERRQEKKATKIAFRNEHVRQNKEMLNIRQNLSGIKIT